MLFLCFFLSKLLINKVELENSVCVTRHPGDEHAIDRPKYRLRPFWWYFRHFDCEARFLVATLDFGYRHSKPSWSYYDWYRRSTFINDPVAGYSATVRDDDLLLKYDDQNDQDNFFTEWTVWRHWSTAGWVPVVADRDACGDIVFRPVCLVLTRSVRSVKTAK